MTVLCPDPAHTQVKWKLDEETEGEQVDIATPAKLQAAVATTDNVKTGSGGPSREEGVDGHCEQSVVWHLAEALVTAGDDLGDQMS